MQHWQNEHYCLSMTMFHRHTREMTGSNFAAGWGMRSFASYYTLTTDTNEAIDL